MTSAKPRPANGPGSNGLRGGIKTFVPKTITGHWLEEFGGPSGYKRGFTTVEYETEGQHQQKGAMFRPPREFGPDLPDENTENLPSSPFQYTNNKYPVEDPWLTTSQRMSHHMLTRDMTKEEETSLKYHLSPEILEKYRKKWTVDPDHFRHTRFVTETRLATASAGGKFAVKSVRPLPGSPKPLELCRNQLVERFGILSFPMLRHFLGSAGELPTAEFRSRITAFGASLKLYQLNQIIAYITPTGVVPVDQFLYTLRGSVQGFDIRIVDYIYSSIRQALKLTDASERISWTDVLLCVEGERHPEVLDGLRDFVADVYVKDLTNVQFDEILELLQDMFAASPEDFEFSMKLIWRFPF